MPSASPACLCWRHRSSMPPSTSASLPTSLQSSSAHLGSLPHPSPDQAARWHPTHLPYEPAIACVQCAAETVCPSLHPYVLLRSAQEYLRPQSCVLRRSPPPP